MKDTLLLASDLHIGRSSSRLPDHARRAAFAAAAWARIVDLAVTESVSAVILGGDVVDEDHRFWEAIGPLESGIQRLAAAAIPVLAVAGNHDCAVLGRLADLFPRDRFALLGRDGTWERFPLRQENGHAWLQVDGWSFPQSRVSHSPLNDYALPPPIGDTPVLGLVHGDLGAAHSPYAPLELARLQALHPQAWLLGHIHAPRLATAPGRPWVLMPGSPQALDPGETGPHGAWLATVEGAHIAAPVQRPLSSAWYEEAAVELGEVSDEPTLEATLLDALRSRAAEIGEQAGAALAHVNVRLRLTGATPVADRVEAVAQRLRQDLQLDAGPASLAVDSIHNETLPALDLEQQARTQTVLGAVARLRLDLDKPHVSSETADLLEKTRQNLERARNTKEFFLLPRDPHPDDPAKALLKETATALLARLAKEAE